MVDAASGDRIGQYVLRGEIGRGAMATVYEAEHVGLGRRVALKRMHPHLAADATAASRFLREGKAATQIRSRHVVDVFDVGTHEGVPYLVMERLDGVDLAAHLRERRRLSLEEIAEIVVPVAVAVHAAHEAGVIHRDLKPSNILLARREGGAVTPIILDFGISKLTADVDRDLTTSEVLLGTVHYMSPEQTRGGRKASSLSDQYALGVLLYECATGVKPFSGATPYAVMHAIVSSRVPAPSALDPTLPPELDEVVLRAMNREPKKRFESVRALGAALLPWATAATREQYAPQLGVDAAAIARTVRRRKPWAVIVAAGAVIAVVIAMGARLVAGAAAERSAAPAPVLPEQAPTPTVTTASGTTTATETTTASATSTAPTDPPPTASTNEPPATSARSLRRGVRPVASGSASPPERGTNGALIVE
jgi:serine/threonine-protein kinase